MVEQSLPNQSTGLPTHVHPSPGMHTARQSLFNQPGYGIILKKMFHPDKIDEIILLNVAESASKKLLVLFA